MTKHTPGPWTASSQWNGLITIKNASGDLIATLEKHASGFPGSGVPVNTHAVAQEANARLIAAAPDLLAALLADREWTAAISDNERTAFRNRWSVPADANASLWVAQMKNAAIAKATSPAGWPEPDAFMQDRAYRKDGR